MDYVKVPYIKLKGKKYMGVIDEKAISGFEDSMMYRTEGISTDYHNQTTQSLYKMYKAGDVPVEDSAIGVVNITSPENLHKIHNILQTIAEKEDLHFEQHEEHLGGIGLEFYNYLADNPNSYWNSNSDHVASLIINNGDGSITFEYLPYTMNETVFYTDGKGNILIPKEDYESNEDIN